ncbi:MAG: WecB/TagA/CpsF family glycosyltransferase [Gemmatimonadetes bacterium]|nr:WecB/TagA/CpsF family glycosyltransferase [Gemmatimonadota bacterium]NIY42892.1 WecB/TagA/CpsF family glycosyltransferase [Gemmatimonadota bacterium]
MTSYDEMLKMLDNPLPDRATTVTVCNVHSVMSARRDAALREAIDGSDIATPDGMPLVWTLRMTAHKGQERVYGPELMRQALIHGVDQGWRHYFFGSSPDALSKLEDAARELAPAIDIVGTHSPPFRPLTEEEEERALQEIRDSGATIVWVGLGMPKQELWMWRIRDRLPGTTVLGVGAAFDFIAQTKPQAPAWMQRVGMEWLFRLASEPRRLWRRYAWNNPAFLVLMLWQVARSRLGGKRPE